jgi:hypothetical protein
MAANTVVAVFALLIQLFQMLVNSLCQCGNLSIGSCNFMHTTAVCFANAATAYRRNLFSVIPTHPTVHSFISYIVSLLAAFKRALSQMLICLFVILPFESLLVSRMATEQIPL